MRASQRDRTWIRISRMPRAARSLLAARSFPTLGVRDAQSRSALVCGALLLFALGSLGGCQRFDSHLRYPNGANQIVVPDSVPREQCKVILPDYRVEPPDLLRIEALNVVPRPPYHLRTLDLLTIEVNNTLPDAPISGPRPVEPGGFINLGPSYGIVKVGGMTVDEATAAIEKHLQTILREPKVTVALAEIGAKQQIAGEHLVTPDGKVILGSYGSVKVVGMTLDEARAAIEQHLSKFLENPEISLDVFAYNSKYYYVITQGAGLGDGVSRFPITGNDTVLDAITQINGLTTVSSKRIWIARPGCNADGQDQILPVDWLAVTQRGSIETNYQVLPGDRIYVAEDKLVAFDNVLAKLIAPVERAFGFTLLGTNTVSTLKFFNQRGNLNNQNPGF